MRVLRSVPMSVFLLVVLILLTKSNYGVYKKNRATRIDREESNKRMVALKEKTGGLLDSLQKLQTERGVEEELRNKFQISKLGEEVLVVVDQTALPEESGLGFPKEEDSYWQKLKLFFGLPR